MVFNFSDNLDSQVLTHTLCKANKDVEGRNGCNSYVDCFPIAKKICDEDYYCKGIAWYENRIEQPLKICLTTTTSANAGWNTMMKSNGILYSSIIHLDMH